MVKYIAIFQTLIGNILPKLIQMFIWLFSIWDEFQRGVAFILLIEFQQLSMILLNFSYKQYFPIENASQLIVLETSNCSFLVLDKVESNVNFFSLTILPVSSLLVVGINFSFLYIDRSKLNLTSFWVATFFFKYLLEVETSSYSLLLLDKS